MVQPEREPAGQVDCPVIRFASQRGKTLSFLQLWVPARR